MKKILLIVTYLLAGTFFIQAQSLYGTTSSGGNDGAGAIIKFMPSTNNLIVSKSFESIAYFPEFTNFIEGTDGKLYGMTVHGGSMNYGVIFSFDPVSSVYTKLKDFDKTNGANPLGSLIQGSDGKLYGMTCYGGSSNAGVIFSFDPTSSVYTKLKDFDGTSGSNPFGTLMQATGGKLYGMTNSGGSSGNGVIFSFDAISSTYTKLVDFVGTNGAAPTGNLIQATNGKLYGTTNNGGTSGNGVVFSFNPISSAYTKLKDLDGTNGAHPNGSLLEATNGKLYGMTTGGGSSGIGVIFSFDTTSSVYTKLMDFDGTKGSSPYGSLVQATNGKLYGLTSAGGTGDAGVVFSFDLTLSTYAKVKDLDITTGTVPYGSLFQAGDGKLYGMTSIGGSRTAGVIFSVDPSVPSYTLRKDLATNEDGTNASASLLQGNNGKLYGMTTYGGGLGYGVIFSLDPTSSIYTKLGDFDKTNGANPIGSLIQGSDGKLYGMTQHGGSSNAGVVFSFDLTSSTFAKLKDLENAIGSAPFGSLVQANDGKLYGMTNSGGSNSNGVIFSFDLTDSIYTVTENFDETNGGTPFGSLIQATDGKLYGMTFYGGSAGHGVLFSYDPVSSSYTKLKDFDNTVAINPYGSLIQATDGKLYGMTEFGSVTRGIIFSLDPVSSTLTKLKEFNGANDAQPTGNLMQASDGKLYGMTPTGGSSNNGFIFSFDLISSTLTKLIDYNGANGAQPQIGSAFIEVSSGTLPVTLISFTGKNNGNSNRLTWKVAGELLNYYELQRSTDGQRFIEVAQIKAGRNNSYTYNDPIPNAASSIYYYRLKSVDKDGNFKFSMVIKIRTDHNEFAMVNPNPFNNKLVVNIESTIQHKATFMITDISGKKLYKENKLLFAGTNIVEINEAGKFPKGTYLLTITSSQQIQNIKVVRGDY